ncbi:hypothetical protein [Bradyrhizobium sp. dw_78]|uniref:hypothetical protein n=1 Tax=Bradyrhizobium sp. dw_78 TaxID=2719793 RepID=UPI001BD4DD2A|nr:hypothetical protein [Bradyrhizobium sp. dw_78]
MKAMSESAFAVSRGGRDFGCGSRERGIQPYKWPHNWTAGQSMMKELTAEDYETAVQALAFMIQYHNLPGALPLLIRMEAERDRLIAEGGALDYARRVLARGAINATIGNDNASPRQIAA